MAIGLEDKKAIIADVNAVANEALSLVIADSRGCTVGEMTGLRRDAREANINVRVVRNTLAKRAVEGTEYECAQDAFKGPSLLAFSMDHPGAAARIFKDFAKENEAFEVRALVVGGQLLDANQIDVLAKMPTRDQAISQLMSVMQAPTAKLSKRSMSAREAGSHIGSCLIRKNKLNFLVNRK